jgi:monoterpene epsilon-lactone hydrolase
VWLRGACPERTVVPLHGGGYCVGLTAHGADLGRAPERQAACRVVVPEYRLAPAHAHPAALQPGG